LVIAAREVADALWVVDGQQRLTALAGSMARPEPIPSTPIDQFVVYFDPAERRFHAPPRNGIIPDRWVPVTLLLDATKLSEWVFKWPHAGDSELRSALFDAGKRIREYRVPMYVLDSDEGDLLKEIFFRINKSGKPLQWSEVYDALYGHEGPVPSSIGDLAAELGSLGMGTLGADELTSCLLAIRGLDVTRTLAEHRRRDPSILKGAVADALPILRQVLSFLRTNAGVPHLRLLPRTFVVEVLGRFFVLHPEPSQRTLELLVRWAWRVFMSEGGYDERTLRRRSISELKDDDEEANVQTLLRFVPREPSMAQWPETYDARAARSRLVLLALASLGPRELSGGHPIDIAALIEAKGPEAFRIVFPVRARATKNFRSPANRMLHPGAGSARQHVALRVKEHGIEDAVLSSHGIPPEAAQALLADNIDIFIERRKQYLLDTLTHLGYRMAGWARGDRDRPSIGYLRRKVAK